MKTTTVISILFLILTECNLSNNNKLIISSKIEGTNSIDSMEKRLNDISDKYQPIKQISLKYLKYKGLQDGKDLMIYNQKWKAPLKYAIRLFGPTPNDYIEKFEKDRNIKIPMFYKEFLLEMNGCFIFGFDLFGMTPSIYESGLLDRKKVQCLDLGTANRNWISEYEIDDKLFHFGCRTYSNEENIGYFVDSEGNIKSIRKNGQLISEWTDFSVFLNEEIEIAENMMINDLPDEEKKKL